VRLEIERFDVGEKRAEAGAEDVYEYTGRTPVNSIELPRTHTGLVYAREMHPQGVAAHGHRFFERTLGLLMFQPGKYRMTVTALNNIPEISSLKTSASILSYSK